MLAHPNLYSAIQWRALHADSGMDYCCHGAAQTYVGVALQTMDDGLAPPGTWIVNAVDVPRSSVSLAGAMVGSLLLVGAYACQRSQ